MAILELFSALLVIGIFIGVVLYLYSDIEGCNGDCYQGRRECSCKGKKDNL